MKRIIPLLLVFFLCSGLAAQQVDSTLYQEIGKLKKEIADLKVKLKRLNAADYMMKKDMESALEELNNLITGLSGEIDRSNHRSASLEASLSTHQQDSSSKIEAMGAWFRQMMTILGLVSLLLFVLLIILVLTNRKRISKEYQKLTAKADNTRDSLEKKIGELEKKQEAGLAELKISLEKGKK